MTTIENSKVIDGETIAEVWCKIFFETLRVSAGILGPTMIRIRTQDSNRLVEQDSAIRVELDRLLKERKKPTINETSSIIFPYRVWKNKNWTIEELSRWYVGDFMPRMRAAAPSRFRRTYFERMIDFSEMGADNPDHKGNQLRFIIERWKESSNRGGHFRQSGLQVAIFDPNRDHSREPYMIFPCLQQLGLHFPSKGTLGLSAYYPTQVLIERAYGNYLGLCQLGTFLADALGVQFTEFVCFIGSPRLNWKKQPLSSLKSIAENYLES